MGDVAGSVCQALMRWMTWRSRAISVRTYQHGVDECAPQAALLQRVHGADRGAARKEGH